MPVIHSILYFVFLAHILRPTKPAMTAPPLVTTMPPGILPPPETMPPRETPPPPETMPPVGIMTTRPPKQMVSTVSPLIQKMFQVRPGLAGLVCNSGKEISIQGIRSIEHCGIYCQNNESCWSFFCSVNSGLCVTSTHVYVAPEGINSCELAADTVYYVTSGAYGTSCTYITDCSTDNSVCLNGTCQCGMGYHFDPAAVECVGSCVKYGNTYRAFACSVINGGVVYPTLSTLEDCKALCSSQTACRAFVWFLTTNDCSLLSVTAATTPVETGNCDYTYYERNCK